VTALRSVNAQGQIVRAGAAIGGSEKTVVNATDILPLLMMQNGSQMVDPASFSPRLDSRAPGSGSVGTQTPATDAFNFYVQFANAGSPYYTWNESQNSSLDSFANSKTAMAFAYQSQLPIITNKNPYLRFGVAAMPQVADNDFNAVNYAHYWALAVPKQSTQQSVAWDFIQYLSVTGALSYSNEAHHPPALRTSIAALEDDPDLGVFARQALTARSWYMPNSTKVKAIFNDTIQKVLAGRIDTREGVNQIQGQISALER
jgi:ABC-type glycerol-3-phosphate transport system substrate-binding protein